MHAELCVFQKLWITTTITTKKKQPPRELNPQEINEWHSLLSAFYDIPCKRSLYMTITKITENLIAVPHNELCTRKIYQWF